MSLGSDLAWLASGLTADATAITCDQPGAVYDRAYAALERTAPLPVGLRERTLLVGAVLLAKNLLFGNSPDAGPVSRLFGKVADDGLVETLKRIIQHAGRPAVVPDGTPTTPGATAHVPLARRMDTLTHTIAPWMR